MSTLPLISTLLLYWTLSARRLHVSSQDQPDAHVRTRAVDQVSQTFLLSNAALIRSCIHDLHVQHCCRRLIESRDIHDLRVHSWHQLA